MSLIRNVKMFLKNKTKRSIKAIKTRTITGELITTQTTVNKLTDKQRSSDEHFILN